MNWRPAASLALRLARRVGAPIVIVLALCVPVVTYWGLTVSWSKTALSQPWGDEPHFLVLAESLRYFDTLDVTSAYRRVFTRGSTFDIFMNTEHAFVNQRGEHWSFHSPGTGYIALVGYRRDVDQDLRQKLESLVGSRWLDWVVALRGPFEVKIDHMLMVRLVFALVCGLMPFVAFFVCRRMGLSALASVMLVLAVFLGMPFLNGAGQIYPDMASGLLTLVMAAGVLSLVHDDVGMGLGAAAAVALGGALLPALHFKNVLPCAVGLAGFLWLTRRRARFIPQRVLVAVVMIAALAGAALYNHTAFDSYFGPQAVPGKDIGGHFTFAPNEFLMILFGLHFDQEHGLFVQNIFLVTGLLGVVPLVRRYPWPSLWLGVLYASVILPNAMHTNWYGGHSQVGRFAWPVVALWLFPCAAFFCSLRWPSLALAAAASVTFWARRWLYQKWITDPITLLQYRTGPGYPVRHSLFSVPEASFARLPSFVSFGNFDSWLRHEPNYVAGALAVILIGLGALPQVRRGVRRLSS